jgi:hypothetical protein
VRRYWGEQVKCSENVQNACSRVKTLIVKKEKISMRCYGSRDEVM